MLVGKRREKGKKRKNLVENMGSKKSNSPRKFTRRSHTRKDTRLCFINMAEARREIVNALHLHRSTSSSPSCGTRWGPTMVANTCNIVVNKPPVTSSRQYYPLLDSLSLPTVPPRWSTTAPSLLPTLTPPPMDSLEFEWPENLSSSYAWWLGFLKTLDGKISTQVSKCPYGENIVMADSRVLGQFPEGSTELGDQPPSLDANDQNPFPDDWLTVPTAEDQGEVG